MQCKSLLLLSLLVATGALAAPAPDFQLKETVTVPRGWVRRSTVEGSALVSMKLGLRRDGMADLQARLLEVSDPTHPDYGMWLSREEVQARLTPSDVSKRAAEDWLASHGIQVSKRSDAGDYLSFDTTFAQARELLGGADYAIYEHLDTRETIVRTTSYSLPRDVAEHIEVVYPSTNFGGPRANRAPYRMMQKEEANARLQPLNTGASAAITPDPGTAPPDCMLRETTRACIQELYHTPNGTSPVINSNFLGIAGYLEQYANYADYFYYEKSQVPAAYAKNYSFTYELVNGGLNDQTVADTGSEANLDVQAALLSYPVPTKFYSTGGRGSFIQTPSTPTNTNEPYADLFEYLLAKPESQLPSVLTNSYDDDESSVAPSYARRVCDDVAALTARGTTVLFSSGDNGVGNDGNCTINGKPQFLPNFPSSCPWGLSVGATERYAPEVAVAADLAGFYSGGGFSNLFPRPAYQFFAVQQYLATSVDPALKKYANFQGRGIPDVAAQGSRYYVRYEGQDVLIGGTSASSPTFASVLVMINDARLARGLPKLGFVNPIIYLKGSNNGLNDILSGSSKGCSEIPQSGPGGFPAAKGWDAVTGWGTPNYPKFAAIFGV